MKSTHDCEPAGALFTNTSNGGPIARPPSSSPNFRAFWRRLDALAVVPTVMLPAAVGVAVVVGAGTEGAAGTEAAAS